jgi:two-component system, NarL family, response regulator DesR
MQAPHCRLHIVGRRATPARSIAPARFAYDKVRRVIRTLVAEPATLAREGLVALLSRAHDIDLVGTVQRGEEVLPAAQTLKPDVAVVAAAFPGHDGIAIARALHTALPTCRCVIMSSGHRLRDLRRAAAANVHGFLVHDYPAELITQAIRDLASGKRVIHPSALGALSCPLTARETDALRLAAQGSTTAEIAKSLCLTAGTVRNYLSRAITKAGARNRVDAIRIANESGWL